MNSKKLTDYQLTMNWSGGMEFGSNSLAIDVDGTATAKIFDAATFGISGVGVFRAKLDSQSLAEARQVNKIICTPGSQGGRPFAPGPTDPAATFIAVCPDDGGALVTKAGLFSLLPKNVFDDVNTRVSRIFRFAIDNGRKSVRLDASVISVIPQGGQFAVTIAFSNSGDGKVRFKRPDLWSGARRMETLEAGALLVEGGKEFDGMSFQLAGQKIVSTGEIPESIELGPREVRRLTFLATPDVAFKKGEYAFGTVVWMNMVLEGEHSGTVKADFTSGENRTRITIDRDYPSTPQEREQWEKDHRENMSRWPVKPGATFAEDGLYRAIRTSGGYRGLLLKPFKAGDIATTDPLTMPMDSRHADDYIQGAVQWLWEASAPTPVKQWSLDLVDGTQHDCEPGAVCPRSGRWVPRVMSGVEYASMEYEYRPAGIVTRRLGDVMPPIRGTQARWEWIGSVA